MLLPIVAYATGESDIFICTSCAFWNKEAMADLHVESIMLLLLYSLLVCFVLLCFVSSGRPRNLLWKSCVLRRKKEVYISQRLVQSKIVTKHQTTEIQAFVSSTIKIHQGSHRFPVWEFASPKHASHLGLTEEWQGLKIQLLVLKQNRKGLW